MEKNISYAINMKKPKKKTPFLVRAIPILGRGLDFRMLGCNMGCTSKQTGHTQIWANRNI